MADVIKMLRRSLVLSLLTPLLLLGFATACARPPAAGTPGPAAPGSAPTVPVVSPLPTTAPPVAPASWADQMLASVNAQRAALGAPPLSTCGSLNNAAQAHSQDQADHNTMTHTGSDGSGLGLRADRAGYLGWTALGENVAMGYPSVDAVMAGWMGSSGHRANLLSTSYVHVGFGLANATNGSPYWTQDFGRSGTC